MKDYVKSDEWLIKEEGLHKEDNRIYESLMSIGNGYMGMRGNFEEDYSGDTLLGTYIAGIYYPDRTRVGWWKNGYPEYFAKVINAPFFTGISIEIDGEKLDINKLKIEKFERTLDMRSGLLSRNFIAIDSKNRSYKIEAKKFFNMVNKEIACVSYSITPLDNDANVEFTSYINGDVKNEDSNYDEKFWEETDKYSDDNKCGLLMKTKKLDFYVYFMQQNEFIIDGTEIDKSSTTKGQNPIELCFTRIIKKKFCADKIKVCVKKDSTVTLNKYVSVTNSRYFKKDELCGKCIELLDDNAPKGFDGLLSENIKYWDNIWENSDIIIHGDPKSQQAIRYNIFQLNQTYTGEDSRLNIGPKGFTGEKYGGSTYWDTEAYCMYFYLGTCDKNIAKQLLLYRYNQLSKAEENAKKLGCEGALYPMVTMNGEECHNEWEITFEEIHRDGAIAYAIYNYVNYTGDKEYLMPYGFEVLVAISRYYASRVTYNFYKDQYMILGVTGPNEYENNVNNNWYTNTIAAWTLSYTLKVNDYLKKYYGKEYAKIHDRLSLCVGEFENWENIIDKMYFPYDEKLGVFEQQDGYMDKEQALSSTIDKRERPINQHWSWDRILRSCFIKQADVLQGMFFFNDKFDYDIKKKNFDFYEPRCVHESSLSPCVHSILAAELNYKDKAYEMYLRASGLDLNNYNNDTEDGLHITSMAGTWMSAVYGFGGMRVIGGTLCFSPMIPGQWKEYSFRIVFRDRLLQIIVNESKVKIEMLKGEELSFKVYNKEYKISQNNSININLEK